WLSVVGTLLGFATLFCGLLLIQFPLTISVLTIWLMGSFIGQWGNGVWALLRRKNFTATQRANFTAFVQRNKGGRLSLLNGFFKTWLSFSLFVAGLTCIVIYLANPSPSFLPYTLFALAGTGEFVSALVYFRVQVGFFPTTQEAFVKLGRKA